MDIRAIVADDVHVWWVARSTTSTWSVTRSPVLGGELHVHAASSRINGIAVDGEFVFALFPDGTRRSEHTGERLGGGTAIHGDCDAIAIFDKRVYTTCASYLPCCDPDAAPRSALIRTGIRGPKPSWFPTASVAPRGIAVDDEHLYWLDGGKPGSPPSGEVLRLPRDLVPGTPVETLARQQANPVAIAVGKDHVYWTNRGFGAQDGAILGAPLAGGAAVVLASQQHLPRGIHVDGTHVYWLDEGSDTGDDSTGAVMRAELTSGAVEVVAPGQQLHDSGLAGDGTFLFWASGPRDAMTLFRLRKATIGVTRR